MTRLPRLSRWQPALAPPAWQRITPATRGAVGGTGQASSPKVGLDWPATIYLSLALFQISFGEVSQKIYPPLKVSKGPLD